MVPFKSNNTHRAHTIKLKCMLLFSGRFIISIGSSSVSFIRLLCYYCCSVLLCECECVTAVKTDVCEQWKRYGTGLPTMFECSFHFFYSNTYFNLYFLSARRFMICVLLCIVVLCTRERAFIENCVKSFNHDYLFNVVIRFGRITHTWSLINTSKQKNDV